VPVPYAFPLVEPRPQRFRRVLNVLVASLGILLTLPLWVVIAVAIRLTSRGPVLYRQTRVGLDSRRSGMRSDDPRRRQDLGGRPFTIYKFRTMHLEAEAGTGETWATPGDCRATAVGRFLRHYRLDELPQLINVLRGDMNVVGPRPERPGIFAELRRSIPNYHLRQRTLPGITGHAQINLEYDSSLEDVRRKVEHDLTYLERASWWEDLKIMLRTIPVMLFRRGSR
jgi:lipopolysaccharide/colanic/teichoic acid biosynthesis glycosyltransferase